MHLSCGLSDRSGDDNNDDCGHGTAVRSAVYARQLFSSNRQTNDSYGGERGGGYGNDGAQ